MGSQRWSGGGRCGSDLIDAARRGAGTRWPGPGGGVGVV